MAVKVKVTHRDITSPLRKVQLENPFGLFHGCSAECKMKVEYFSLMFWKALLNFTYTWSIGIILWLELYLAHQSSPISGCTCCYHMYKILKGCQWIKIHNTQTKSLIC